MPRTFFKRNKYNAVKTEYNGVWYDSKYEASVAQELDLRLRAKDFKSWERQFKIEAWAYTKDGQKAFKVTHRVDFRILHNDGSYELLEAKGTITTDYKWRKKFLEQLWLPEHPDHIYTVVKQGGWRS